MTLGHRPAGLDQLALPAVVAPVRLRVPDLGIDAEVAAVSSTPAGEVAVPPSRELVAWYEHGASPGDAGNAVLAAHVDWNGQPGPFFTLDELPAGASVVVVRADGSEVAFRVTSVERMAKAELPTDRLFARDGAPGLALVTCGGSFDPARHRYDDNVIAWAEPA